MKQECVTIGMQARVKIGQRLAEVTVLRQIEGRGRARFECRTSDTGRLVRATAARLRPMPHPAVRAMVDRMVAASSLTVEPNVTQELEAWAASPVGAW